MSRQQSRQVIERELGGRKLESVFEWIELSPIGSASIAQVRLWPVSAIGVCVSTGHQGTNRSSLPMNPGPADALDRHGCSY